MARGSAVHDEKRAYTLQRDEGRHLWFLGSLMTVKAGAAETAGSMSLIEQVAPPGFGSPLHVHAGEDEPMYILEGRFTFWVGERELPVEAGTFVFLPRDVPHCFRVEGDTPGRLLQLTLPAGLEEGFAEMGEPAPGPVLPPPVDGPPDPAFLARMEEVAVRYGVQLLGPPKGPA
jgi:mannose-6-phosphate isomerase-like protein (cupin superfamily)